MKVTMHEHIKVWQLVEYEVPDAKTLKGAIEKIKENPMKYGTDILKKFDNSEQVIEFDEETAEEITE